MKPFTSLSKWYVGLLVLIGSLWSVPALGAEPYVEGVVRDTLGGGIPYATVSLLPESAETGTVEDGAVVIGSITDESGRYRIDGVAAGHYQLVCDHLSFVSQQRSVVVRSGRNVHDFLLVPAAEAIEEVEVVGTTVQYEAGKYSIRLAESAITKNKTVEETLKMLPGLSVVDGVVKLDGQPVALVYIDDREVRDVQELKALKGKYIESVEVQNQTGSAYSATYQGGIVRIKLKKTAERSDIGSVSLSPYLAYGHGEERLSYGGFLNSVTFVRRGKMNIYNLFSPGGNDVTSTSSSVADYYTDGYRLSSQIDGREFYGRVYDVFGLVYDLDERSDIGVTAVMQLSHLRPHNVTHSVSEMLSESEAVQLPGYESSDYVQQTDQMRQEYLVGFNYNRRLDTLGSKLVLKADYYHNSVRKDELYDTEWQTASGATWEDRYRQRRYVTAHMLMSRLDFTKVLRAGRAIDAGLTYNLDHTDEWWSTEQWADDVWSEDSERSRSFLSQNHEATAYAIYRDSYDKFSYSVGANLQWDRIAYEKSGGALTARNYVQPFGNISVAYAINPQRGTNINLDVSRYISALPTNRQLSTYEERLSENVYYVGNEHLKLPTGYRARLSYTLRSAWRFSYGFGVEKDGIYDLSWVDPERPEVVWQSPVNGTRAYSHGLNVSWNQSVTDWLQCSVAYDCAWVRDYYEDYMSEIFRFSGDVDLWFQLPQGVGFHVWGRYESPFKKLGFQCNDDLRVGFALDRMIGKRVWLQLNVSFRMWDRVNTNYQLDGSYVMRTTYVASPLEMVGFTLSYDFLMKNPVPIRMVETMQKVDNAW